MDPSITEKIEKSTEEIDKYLNFLTEDKYRNPESEVLRKENREDFFKDFHQDEKVYYTVDKWDKHELKVYMLIPKTLKVDQNISFHVIFHGGGLTTGGGNYVHWFCDYKLDLAIKANAITLIPMYRLMPEDRGTEIYADIDNWWKFYNDPEHLTKWVQECLRKHNLNVEQELLKIKGGLLISGESAGGLLAVRSWLEGELNIRALYLQYPVLKYYEKDVPNGKPVVYMGLKISKKEVEWRATKLIEIADAQRAAGCSVSRSDTKPPLGMLGAMLLSNTKKWEAVFKDGKDVMDAPGLLAHKVATARKEATAKPQSFPKVFIIHGMEDNTVPIKNTEEFVESLKKALKEWECTDDIEFIKLEGLGHVFDYESRSDDTCRKQISEVMESVIAAWIG